jgi:hypothetical protein
MFFATLSLFPLVLSRPQCSHPQSTLLAALLQIPSNMPKRNGHKLMERQEWQRNTRTRAGTFDMLPDGEVCGPRRRSTAGERKAAWSWVRENHKTKKCVVIK